MLYEVITKSMRLLVCINLIILSLFAADPQQWGENVTGVTTAFHSDKKEIALTFDACGGSERSSQYDAEP